MKLVWEFFKGKIKKNENLVFFSQKKFWSPNLGIKAGTKICHILPGYSPGTPKYAWQFLGLHTKSFGSGDFLKFHGDPLGAHFDHPSQPIGCYYAKTVMSTATIFLL